jgi:hypothetical protein
MVRVRLGDVPVSTHVRLLPQVPFLTIVVLFDVCFIPIKNKIVNKYHNSLIYNNLGEEKQTLPARVFLRRRR